MFLSLRGRLILFVCFAAVPALLFIFLIAAREREAALERMETEAIHLGSLASREHAHQLNGARNLLRHLDDVLSCDAVPPAQACPEDFPPLLSAFPQFANIGIADPSGNVICTAASIRQPAALTHNAAFFRALTSKDVETGDYTMGFVGRPVLHLALAMRDAGNAVCAVPFVAVELGWLDQLARQANLPADYSLTITDREGQVLARSAPTTPGQELSGSVLKAALDRPRGAVLEVGSPPTPQYFVATPMEGVPGIFVVAGLPYARVQEATNQAFYRTLLGLIFVTILAIMAALGAAEFSVLRVLRGLTRTVRRFGAGDLSARPPLPGSHGELRELAVSFSAMADALAIRQREAEAAQERLRALSHRLQDAREAEAGRIARELHDELGQVLTGLKLELSQMRRASPVEPRPAETEQRIGLMIDHIDGAIDTVRRISSELHPPVLDRLGLVDAIDWLAREYEKKSGLAIAFTPVDVKEPVDRLVATAVFRIAQEALTNVMRHAEATDVTVDLVGREETIALTIHDNGKGMDPAPARGPHALGILSMRERVRLLGGMWRLESGPDTGTTIAIELPWKPPSMVDAGSGAEPS